jgi:hypothetical protein
MRGQWRGKYSGDVEGSLYVNIDEVGGHFEGEVYILPTSTELPSSKGEFTTKTKYEIQQVEVLLSPVNPDTGFDCIWDDIKGRFDDSISHAKTADISLKVVGQELHIKGITNLGTQISAVLVTTTPEEKSKVTKIEMSWDGFKENVAPLLEEDCLFRGQREPWRLQTSFHRGGRSRINTFTQVDVPKLHQRISGLTDHYFDLSIPIQNGAFFNLLQHHGYPTPLLDWSYSPFVAAFFAFKDVPIGYSGEDKVRIYVFASSAWKSTFNQIENLNPAYPHLSVIEFIAINNPRLIPQQSVTTITNVDDIEAYVLEKEMLHEAMFLRALDIPAKEREKVMRELRFMGITSGSMFPGIEGACKEMREMFFDR